MKIYDLGLVCVLMGSWRAVGAMELQVEQLQEICICSCQDSVGAWKNVS